MSGKRRAVQLLSNHLVDGDDNLLDSEGECQQSVLAQLSGLGVGGLELNETRSGRGQARSSTTKRERNETESVAGGEASQEQAESRTGGAQQWPRLRGQAD